MLVEQGVIPREAQGRSQCSWACLCRKEETFVLEIEREQEGRMEKG